MNIFQASDLKLHFSSIDFKIIIYVSKITTTSFASIQRATPTTKCVKIGARDNPKTDISVEN